MPFPSNRKPYDPTKPYIYKERTQKQKESWSRNFTILRLRSGYSLAHLTYISNNKEIKIFNSGEISEIYSLIDLALKRLNALTLSEQNAKWEIQRKILLGP